MRRDGPPSGALAGVYSWTPRVSSWRGGRLLADNIPISGGRLTSDMSQDVPERVTLTVPNRRGLWSPGNDRAHPLASCGQRLMVSIDVTTPLGGQWSTRIGTFPVQGWRDDDDGTVEVEAVGLLQLIADDKLLTPTSPPSGATLASELRRLVSDGVPVVISDSLANRPCPTSFAWSGDRLAALQDIVAAWPARMGVDQFGSLAVNPGVLSTTAPVIAWTDGRRGTIIATPTSGGRDGVFNVWVVSGTATDDPSRKPVSAVVAQLDGDFATSIYNRVVGQYSSPMLTTEAQCRATGEQLLRESIRPAQTVTVVCPPDPRVELVDPVTVTRDGDLTAGWVVGYDMPLVVTGAAERMTVTVGVG